MRITSKKMLAIVLSVAMLVSCMVFSFSANAASSVIWQNDFDNVTATNWASLLPASSTAANNDYRSYASSTALYDATAGLGGDGAIKLNLNAHGYATGFRLFDEDDATSSFNNQTGTACTQQGKFTIPNYGKWAVSFAYKLNSTDAPVDLYAAVGGYYWSGDWNVNASKVVSGSRIVKAATVTSMDAGEWRYATVDFEVTGTSTNGVHLFAQTASGTTAVTAEIVIDDVEVINYGSSDTKHKVSYVYNGDVVGTSATGPAMSYVNSFDLDVEAPAGYSMELYSDAALENKVDIVRHDTTDSVVYVKMVADANVEALYTEDYERLGSHTFGITDNGITYSDLYKYGSSAANTLTGNGSGRIVSNKFAGGEHGVTQGFINAFADNLALTAIHSSTAANLVPQAGASYIVTFDMYADSAVSVETSLFDRAFTDWYSSTHNHEKTVTTLTAGEWTTVTVKVDNAAANGQLMLGVGVVGYEFVKRDETGYPPVIYIDNVAVTELASLTPAADALVQGFESIKNYTSLRTASHASQGNAQVTSSAKRNGNQSVWLQTANNSGALRIQFNIPGVDSEYMTAEKGTTYRVTFYVMPKDENPKMQMNFWLAAADKDYRFADGTDKSNYTLYEASNVDLVAGAWNKISFTTTDPVNDVYAGGVMRLGICGPEAKTYDFWVDDIKVEAYADSIAWGFESEAVGTDVDSKKAKGYTSVSTDYAYSGNQSLYVYNGSNGGRDRNMIYLKDGAGNNVTVEAGKKYLVSFYAMATDASAKSVGINTWFATGNGTAVRPASGSGDINLFFDDVGTTVVSLTSAANKNKWVKVTRYLEVTDVSKGDNLLMGISDPTASNVGGHWYMDDLSVVCVDDIAITEKDRTAYLYRGEAKNGYTNLHTNTANAEDDGIYTSIRLGAKYRSGDANGSTYILDGVEYEIVERGIVAGKAGMTLDATGTKGTDYLWKSSVTSNNGFASNWKKVGVDLADAADQNEITYTLRLANMSEAWFAEDYDQEFEFRSYFVLKAPYIVKNSTSVSNVTFTVYGTTSDAFTFDYLASTFAKDFWFTDLAS